MQLNLTDEQAQIRDVVVGFLAGRYDHTVREHILRSDSGWSAGIWKSFAEELGILGLTFPQAAGGIDGGPIDALMVMDAFGEALVVEPYLETCILGAALLKQVEGARASALMTSAVNGEARFALAAQEPGRRYAPYFAQTVARADGLGYVLNGRKTMVIGAGSATHFFVTAQIESRAGLAIFAVECGADGLALKHGRTLDGKTVAELNFVECAVAGDTLLCDPAAGSGILEFAIAHATAAICAEAAGIMRRMVRDTLAYLEQRRQFGSALIEFQVLQHRLADMQVHYEHVEAMAFFAAEMLSRPVEQRRVGISAAKVHVAKALRAVAQDVVQMHGAMGITEELAIGHLFKRAAALENEFGSIDYHLTQVQQIGLPFESLADATNTTFARVRHEGISA